MKGFWLLLLFVVALPAWSAIDTYQFSDEKNRELFHNLATELRCPKCQNQNLADSNSPIAADMRREIHRMVEEGQSEEQVVDFMVARYGDFVRYRPKRDESTWMLWYGPLILIGLGGLAVLLVSRRRKPAAESPAQAAQPDRQKLDKILDQYQDD